MTGVRFDTRTFFKRNAITVMPKAVTRHIQGNSVDHWLEEICNPTGL